MEKARRFLRDGGIVHIYTAFLAGYFLLPMAAGHRRIYYFIVMPAVLLMWRELLVFYRYNALAWLLLLYAGYMAITLTWTTDFDAIAALSMIWYSLSVLSFVMITGYLWVHYPDRMQLLAGRLVWLAAATALVSMVVWYHSHPFPGSRLEPLGVMHHPNKSGCAYGLLMLLAVYRAYTANGRHQRLYCIAAAVILLCLVVLTQSRTALVASGMGLAALLGYRSAVLLAPALVASWVAFAATPGLWQERVMMLSFRPGIWRQVIAEVREHPWFGHGYLVDPSVPAYGKVFSHAHNSYLATLRDGGTVGLVLLVALLVVALRWAWQLRVRFDERIYLAMLVYGAISLVMDYDRLLVQPKELWLFFWMPVALVMAVLPERRGYRPAGARGS